MRVYSGIFFRAGDEKLRMKIRIGVFFGGIAVRLRPIFSVGLYTLLTIHHYEVYDLHRGRTQ